MKIDLEKIKRLPPDVRKEFMKTFLKYQEKRKEGQIAGDFMSFVKHVWPDFIEGSHHKIVAEKFNQIAEGKLKKADYKYAAQTRSLSLLASCFLLGWWVETEAQDHSVN